LTVKDGSLYIRGNRTHARSVDPRKSREKKTVRERRKLKMREGKFFTGSIRMTQAIRPGLPGRTPVFARSLEGIISPTTEEKAGQGLKKERSQGGKKGKTSKNLVSTARELRSWGYQNVSGHEPELERKNS